MAARPTRIPRWATNAAYAAVGLAWDGVAPTLEPPDGLKEEGWEPGVAPNARYINWLFNQLGGWIALLADLQLRNWVSRTDAFTAAATAASISVTALWRTVYDAGAGGANPQMLVLGSAAGGDVPPAMLSLSGAEFFDTRSGITGVNYALRNGVYVDGDSINLWIIVGDAVAGTGKVATHPRDLSAGVWTMRTSSAPTRWNGIAHGLGEANPVVIVGTGGTIDSSTNGTLWINRTSGTAVELHEVAYGNGQYVAVGDTGTILTSPTGAAWTARTAAGAGDVTGVAYDSRSAKWVIVDGIGQVYTSADAITWTLSASPPAFVLDGAPLLASDRAGTLLAYEPTTTGTLAYVSTDGAATWGDGIWIGERSTDGNYIENVSYCGEMGWMSVGPAGPASGVVHQSLRL